MTGHAAIHMLRGATIPNKWFLDLFHRRFPSLVLGWCPAFTVKKDDGTEKTQGGYWALYERWGSFLWRDAGLARRRKFTEPGPDGTQPNSPDPATWWDIEAQIDGLHMIGTFPHEAIGTVRMLDELSQTEQNAAQVRADVEDKMREHEQRDVEDVASWDPVFAQYCDDVAADEFKRLCRDRKVFVQPGAKEQVA